LQQGTKAAKNATGYFKKDSILKTVGGAYDQGYYIYDTGSKLTYTATPKLPYKTNMTEFLNSSSMSATAKTIISSSFNAASWPDLIVQIDEGAYAPATASWTVPTAFIGDAASTLVINNTSTNATNIKLKSAGASVTDWVRDVEFTLPMEDIKFTGTFASRSIKFSAFSGSQYSPTVYANSAIYTPYGSAETTASLIGKVWGSGSVTIHPRGLYDWVEYGGYLMALGDDIDSTNTGSETPGGYVFSGKLDILHFPAGSVVASESFTARYAKTDTFMTGSAVQGTIYFVSGSLSATGSSYWDNTFPGGQINTQDSGSHVFADATLSTAASEGIYVFAGSPSGSLVTIPNGIHRVPRFSGYKY
jgi:hypothetical protein